MKNLLSTVIFCLLSFGTAAAQIRESRIANPINSGWKFREANKADWRSATVPGTVHTDLLANKAIEDPFYRDNEKKQQWIGKTDWEYQTTFLVSAEVFRR